MCPSFFLKRSEYSLVACTRLKSRSCFPVVGVLALVRFFTSVFPPVTSVDLSMHRVVKNIGKGWGGTRGKWS
jgi:hypothetical protein